MPWPVDKEILPGLVTGLVSIADAATEPPLEALNPDWRPKRAREFAAGRNVARRLLSEMSLPLQPIGVAAQGGAAWPEGVVGSIAHTDTDVCVTLGGADKFTSVGVDLEPAGAVELSLFEHLFVAEELRALAAGRVDPTLLFCCKEAVYKAVHPLHGEMFDFTDLKIEVGHGAFRAEAVTPTLSSADTIQANAGLVRWTGAHWLTCFTIPAPGRMAAANRAFGRVPRAHAGAGADLQRALRLASTRSSAHAQVFNFSTGAGD